MLRGLLMLQRRLDSTDGSQELDLAPTPLVDGPSLKLDQHESSHSHILPVTNDALLNMIVYMP